ncbi:histidine--tRNA ligase, partial [Candidatus Berkelbacteria bacterium]|nr:histidine--tRNA ligase [Candidatus Berkelbacteria bacterium]
VFVRALGEGTDVVEKEMFQVSRFKGAEDTKYSLRPENTAGIVRSFIEQGMSSWPQPVKLWYFGPQFRADRPQKGRMRQFTQFGYEVLGDDDPATDALTILLTKFIFDDCKLGNDIVFEINTIGSMESRADVVKAIKTYYQKQQSKLCDDCKRRLKTNPLRLLDCKEDSCQPIKQNAPKIPELVSESDKKHFKEVLEYLDVLGIAYELNPYLVRGFDYYTRTTFEVRDKSDTGRQSSLGGGGRYDGLVELYSGPKTPAIGFSGGVERILAKLQEKEIMAPEQPKPDTLIVALGQVAKKEALKVLKELAQAGMSVTIAPSKESLKSQLRLADTLGVTVALVIGEQEVRDGTIMVRNMVTGSQKTVKSGILLPTLRKALK